MFLKRLLSSIVLVILALLFLITGGLPLLLQLLLLSLVSYRELMAACHLAGGEKDGKKTLCSSPEILGYCGIAAYYAVMFLVPEKAYLLVTVFLVLSAFMALFVAAYPKYGIREIMMSVFCLFYAPLMMSFIYLTRELTMGIYAVWMIFISSWICDTCAYCVGKLCGKHKLTPVLSPKKTIEGSVGGILGSAIVGGLFAHFLIRPVYPDVKYAALFFALIAAVGAVISQVGDLAASGLKRNMEIKDFGKLIPGHGGVMDRFDSVVFTAPVVFFLTLLLTKQV